MELFRLIYWMQDFVPKIREVDGYLFLDRFDAGEVGLRSEATERYSSLAEAQLWMNTVLMDGFISEIVGDQWDLDDPLITKFLEIYETAWTFQIKTCFPGMKFTIEKMMDNESGDIGLRLVSKP